MENRLQKPCSRPAVKRAIEYGIDVTLLVENLRYTPTERLRRHQAVLESIMALREEVGKHVAFRLSGRQGRIRP